ncbi:MAG: chemotaxis protein CheW [Cyanobacteria bacterium J06600_6]
MSNSVVVTSFNQAATGSKLIKLLVFEIGKLTLAIPILQVQKVIRRTEVYGSGLSYVNLTHLNEVEVTVVDLHQKLFGVSQNQSESPGYFIISQNIAGESLGIVVPQSPALIDVAIEQIRLLPDTYRRADTLEIASHVTVLTQDETTTAIFILDLTRLVTT